MKRQHGQTLVEFALIAPLMFLLVFAMIYGGVMFIDYLNFNNEARTLARQIAVSNSSDRGKLLTEYSKVDGKSFERFYNVTMKAGYGYAENDPEETTPVDAIVVVEFKRDNTDLPWIVYKIGFPPKEFAIQYRMKLEKTSS